MTTGILRLFIVFGLLATRASAYVAPQDTAGPLTVRIEGPQQITKPETPVAVAVVLVNTAEVALTGTLSLTGTDGWQIQPAGDSAFSVSAGASQRVEFTVVVPKSSYTAHYPLHAFAKFTFDGQKLTAHPILVVETKLAPISREQTAPAWKPVELARDAGLALWRLPVYRAMVQVFKQPPLTMPVAWQGSEPGSRASLQVAGRIQRGDTRETIALHPPYNQGHVGTVLIEFPLTLPNQPARLQFANAVRDSSASERPGDGVTFRVRVLPLNAPAGQQGAVVFERHTDSKLWLAGEADLSGYAGKSVRLQLESHPGPKNDTNVDQSYWAEPVLLTGKPPAEAAFPPAVSAEYRSLGRIGEYEVRLWPGQRGLLDSSIGFVKAGQSTVFQGFPLRVLGNALEDWRSPMTLLAVSKEPAEGRLKVRHRFKEFDLFGEIWTDGQALRVHFWLENTPAPQPWRVAYIEEAGAGRWSAKVRRVYAGVGNVIEKPAAFRLGFDGHRLATSFIGLDFESGLSLVQGVDLPPTEFELDPAKDTATLRSAHGTTFTFIPAATVWDGVKVWRDSNGLSASAGVPKLAGRFVFDLWGGRYGASADALRKSAAYGLVDSVVIWHNWQRWGYDYRLPDIFPATPQWGTQAEFVQLAQTTKQNGMLFAPHDNYIDFYPDADGYSYSQIAFQKSGRPVKAWLNEGRQAQSYRWLTDRYRTSLERNVNALKDSILPTAYFIDVWSSVGPFDSWTQDGRLIDRVVTRNAWGDAFAWIRNTLGDEAPQISESGHDALIGWLDGASTNHLRVDTPPPGSYKWAVWNIACADSERIPWFDMAHHDRFALHGAGYDPRYSAGLDRRLHGIYSDDYITTEVLTGHPAMVSEAFSRNAVRKYWLLHDLGRALALKRIEDFQFEGGDLHRQRVRWSAGEVVANRGAQDWTLDGRVLPQYGFYARVPLEHGIVEAAIERRDGVIVDWSRSPNAWFVNARPVISDRLPFRVTLDSLTPAGARRYQLQFHWEVAEPAAQAWRILVHFVDKEGKIRFQADHDAAPPTNQWKGTQLTNVQIALPENFQEGDSADLRIGFYDPATGARALPLGPDDGDNRRIRLGTVTVKDGALLWTPFDPGEDLLLQRLNPEAKLIAFGPASTNGAAKLHPVDSALWVTPLPQGKPAVLRLRWAELPWKLPMPTVINVRGEDGSILRSLEVIMENDEVVLRMEPGVFAYELR